jgi:hypothetical protein
MRPELVAVEIIAQGGVEREAVAVQTDYRHDFRQTPLHVRAPSQQMYRPFEKRKVEWWFRHSEWGHCNPAKISWE